MKYILLFISIGFYLREARGQNGLPVAQTPPMGWNSYNCYGSTVHEDEVKANTDYMAEKLKSFDWQYIVVDFLWSYDNPPESKLASPPQKNLADGSYIPFLAMDKWGRLLPNINKFPSSFGGVGFRPLADYVHKAGLRFGIHVMRGIPRQAVFAKAPILGLDGITADMIADTNSVCTWNNHMYGLDMERPGAQEYLNSLLDLYSEWNVDFIKVDDLSKPYSRSEIEGYRKAINQCGRPIVFSLSPGATPIGEADNLVRNGNMWRLAEDFWDNWKEMINMFKLGRQWENIGGPGHWPDCDMLQIGKLSKRGPVGEERYSRFTNEELYSHMTFWSIFKSPLMLGGNLPENREIEERLLTNEEVLAVNQHGQNPREIYNKNGKLVWTSSVPDDKGMYVAIFNLNENIQKISIDLTGLGFRGIVHIRDLWKRKDLGQFVNEYEKSISSHGCVLLKVSK